MIACLYYISKKFFRAREVVKYYLADFFRKGGEGVPQKRQKIHKIKEGVPKFRHFLVLLCLFLALLGSFLALFGPYLTLFGENSIFRPPG